MNKPLALERGISLHRSPVRGQWSGGLLYRGISRGKWFCFIGRPCLLGSPEICKRKLWKRVSLSTEAPLGNPEGTRLPGTLRDGPRRLWKRNIYLYGSSAKGTWREGSFTEYSEEYTCIQEGYGNGHVSPQGSVWQPGGGGFHLPGTLRDSTRGLCKRSVSLYGCSVKGIWRERSITGNSAS
jgi:hypothetical protein